MFSDAFVLEACHTMWSWCWSDTMALCIRDVRKPNFGSVSVFKNRNWTEPKPKGQTRNFGFCLSKLNLSHTNSQSYRHIQYDLGHIKNIHLHRSKHKSVKLKLTLTLTLTDTGGAVLTLMLGYRRLGNYKLKRKIQIWDCGNMRGVYS